MSKLDELISQELSQQDREILEATKEQGWFALGLSQFRGKLAWVTWSVLISQGLIFLVGLWCAIQFFQATDVVTTVKWGISGAVLILIATTLKLSLMPQMQADRVLRELKRLELMIALEKK